MRKTFARRLALASLAVASSLAFGSAVLPALAQDVNTSANEGKAVGQAKRSNNLYIVELAEEPIATYTGGIAGYAATKPRKGQKINPNDPQVVRYGAYLNSRHDALMAAVGASKKSYSYNVLFNGFAAELTPEQAQRLATMKGVLSVTKDQLNVIETDQTPNFLGLTDPSNGLWAKLGGVDNAGEGIIIGIVDSGVWPEHPSFSDRTGLNGNGTQDGKLSYQQIPGWNGKCTPGEAFNASDCNQKLIGARYYNAGWGGNEGVDAQLPFEFNSPRDHNGHGTHTATTAGGNHDVQVSGLASVLGKVSGIAPRARIAAYKACWSVPGTAGSCFTVDTLAAIDQAVADGVDVINYSISGTRTNFRDPIEIAFLRAADAGVFVAASAGNSGPTASTVAHPSPWITTVAASTQARNGEGSATLGNGATYNGASTATGGSPTAAFIDATAAGLPGADPTAVRLCFAADDNGGQPVLDPALVAGKIVLCDRGVNARVNKSLAVKQAGGVGMILVNTSPNSLNADLHYVPTVHVADTTRAALKAYAATTGATATVNKAVIVNNATAPLMASFSSRGPLLAGGGDLLKPDVTAPGVDILAGVAPPNNAGELFALYSGTSMSSPHVAGLAALLKQAHPDWSPMAIKSALMTTAYQTTRTGTTGAGFGNVFTYGAGHVDPNVATNPGLVYDSGFNDWLGFLCGTQLPTSFCTSAGVPVLDPSDLNLASIAIGDLAGTQTVKRAVTNVSGTTLTMTASAAVPGVDMVVSPSTLTLKPGETKGFTVRFTRAAATLNAYTQGQLVWTGGGFSVRSPVVVRPVALAAPVQVGGSYDVTFGYSGAFTATARGLVEAAITAGTVLDDPTNGDCSLTTPNALQVPVSIPAGTTYARFSLFDADVNAGADIDLCVFNAGGTLVGASGSGTSAEEVNLLNPAAGNYTVVVQGYDVGAGSPFKLHTWLLGTAATGNMTVSAPATATIGGRGTIGLSFTGLASGKKYLGSVAYSGATGMPTPTIVRIDQP